MNLNDLLVLYHQVKKEWMLGVIEDALGLAEDEEFINLVLELAPNGSLYD